MARHLSIVVPAFLLCVACILSADAVSRINGSQIALGAITNAHVASDAAISASKLDSTLATKSYVDAAAQGAPVGTIIMCGGATPSGYLYCDGASYDGSSGVYAALWSVIGNTYGGTTSSAFQVPDMRGRVAVGTGQGTGLSSRSMGAKSGEERHMLVTSEMPSHDHGIEHHGSYGGQYGLLDSANATSSGFLRTSIAGGDQPHNNMQPFLVVRFAIKY